MNRLPIGVQIYTVRDEAEKDLYIVLEKIAQMGYEGVEFAGYYGIDVKEIKKKLDALGLKTFGTHNGYNDCLHDLDRLIEENLILGSPYLICPGGVPLKEKEDYFKAANQFNNIGEKCRKKGLFYGYHNHSHEFTCFDGTYGLDLLYQNSDPDLVKIELDAGWAMHAGADPVAFILKHGKRCPLIHLKDFKNDGTQTEVGCGLLDTQALIKVGMQVESEYLIIEQDRCEIPSLDSIRISLQNTKDAIRVVEANMQS